LTRLIRKPPSRLFSPKKVKDIRNELIINNNKIEINEMNSIELSDFIINKNNSINSNKFKNKELIEINENEIVLNRFIELLPKMDPIIITRILHNLIKKG